MPVVVAVPVVARHHKTVVAELQPVFECPFADHLDGEAVQFAHSLVLSARRGIPGYLLQVLADCLLVGGIQPVNPEQVQPVAFLVCPGGSGELLPVLRHGGYGGLVVPQFSGLSLQFQFGLALALAERLAFTLQRGNLLLQLRLVNMDTKDSIENFIINLNMLTRTYNETEFINVLLKSPQEKSEIAVSLLNELYETGSVVFIEDNMACVLPNRTIPEWLSDIISNKKLNPQLGLYIQSHIVPNIYLEATYPEIAHISLMPLNRKDRYKLFYSYIRTYEIDNITEEDVSFFVDRLLQSPVQIQQAVEAIKTKSIALAKKDIDTLIIMGDKKIHPLLDRYKEDEQRHLLVIMSQFDFISYDILEDIFEERIKEVLETIFDMMVFGIVSTFGPSDRFFRLDHYLSDYIKRNHFSLPKDLELHINDILEKNIDESTDITKDTSLYLYEIKRKIMAGHGNTNSYLIPSIIIKSIMDIYYKRDYNHVIEICDKVLNDNHNFYSETTRELKYWLCLALCRTQNEQRFYDEVKSIEGADYWFLRGFYQRIATDYTMAEKSFRKSLNLAPSMQRAKRELVTVLLALHHYPEALSLAKENFERDSDNTYHIHAYFRCLVKKVNCDREDIDTLKNLLNNMQNSYSDKKDELYTAMNIEYQAYIKRKEPNVILELIKDAKKQFPTSINIERAAHEYMLKQKIVSKDMVFPED